MFSRRGMRQFLYEFWNDPDPTDYYGDIKASIVFLSFNMGMVAFSLMIHWVIK